MIERKIFDGLRMKARIDMNGRLTNDLKEGRRRGNVREQWKRWSDLLEGSINDELMIQCPAVQGLCTHVKLVITVFTCQKVLALVFFFFGQSASTSLAVCLPL